MSRPQKEIDKEEFEKLCELQCTEEEIALWFNVSTDTILVWCKRTYEMSFAEISRQKRVLGKILLRKIQWNMAKDSPTMSIFLGKNYLGQSDTVQKTIINEKPIKIYFEKKGVLENG